MLPRRAELLRTTFWGSELRVVELSAVECARDWITQIFADGLVCVLKYLVR